jgi:putative colanic acid biosynthesis acetyltransferase WcaB
MELIDLVRSDFQANKENWKGTLLLTLYRLAHAVSYLPRPFRPIGYIYLFFYKFFTELIMGIEIDRRCKIGPSATLYHGYGLVIHSGAVIGSGVILRHGVTIGVKATHGPTTAPILGDNVDVGASAIILGNVKIGDGAVIGAGSVVIKDVPRRATVVGNPARVIRVPPEDARAEESNYNII